MPAVHEPLVPTLLDAAPSSAATSAVSAPNPPDSGAAARTERLPLLDLLRAVAAHLIVWHHLAFYGPLSDVVAETYPTIMGFLFEHGRNAVQVFLVIGGFVTAQSLAKRKDLSLTTAAGLVHKRYLRIAGPYIAVLLIAVLANTVADRWMDHDSISGFPTIPQFLAHTVFLHDILGYEALSAGVWYLAIDFQLGLLAVALWWASHRAAAGTPVSPVWWAQWFVWPLALASLCWFNRDPAWDMWAAFFFGSYALGMIAAWALARRLPAWSFWLYVGLMVAALVLEFRPRLAVSLSAGLLIYLTGITGWLTSLPLPRWLAFAGASSYSLFLIHFPVCLVVNAGLSSHILDSPTQCLLGLFAAYGLSVLASIAFYYGVERQFVRERRAAPVATAA